MKKFLFTIILFFITIFTQSVFADEVFKITAANFDNSNSMIVINMPDDSTQPVMNGVKLVKLENRVYFDIPSAVLTIPKQDWKFNTKGITEVKISQFSTSPNAVRVVLYHDDSFNPANLKFLRLQNNIIIKLKNSSVDGQYFAKTYKDDRKSDFYEPISVEIPAEGTIAQIHEALNDTKLDVKKDLKLKSKYYVNNLTVNNNSISINGTGNAAVSKSLVLDNPSRMVFDLPNTVINHNIHKSEYKINETDSVKIAQFDTNTARLVITTQAPKYIPVISSDTQSIAFVLKDNHEKLFSSTSDIIAYNKEKTNQSNSMILSFNHPIVYGIDRTNTQTTVYLYNVSKYNEDTFEQTYKNLASISLLPNVGMKLTIPSSENTEIYTGADGKTLKIQVAEPKKAVAPPKPVTKGKIIVIDPGHGGTDCGAIRNNVTEKAITLDVSKRVRDLLTKQGFTVYMTRDTDETVSLQDRVAFSEEHHADAFVSIHVNSSEKPEITGIETHYWREESLDLAKVVHASLASHINSKNRGLFKSKFYVINHTTSPAILVEIGFISNMWERGELVSDKRKQATAKAIAEGVQNYFK